MDTTEGYFDKKYPQFLRETTKKSVMTQERRIVQTPKINYLLIQEKISSKRTGYN